MEIIKKMKQSGLFLLVVIFAVFCLAGPVPAQDGCDDGGDTPDYTDPAAAGPYSVCSYTLGLSDSGYADAEMFYPCETDQGPFAATTVTSGYTGTYSQMDWISEHLATHGYVVLAMTPNNIMGTNSSWREAHNAGIDQLIEETNRSSSAIYGMVETDKLQVMGHSKGGGGCLLASADQGSNIASTIALAPYMDFSYDLSTIASATQLQTGTDDAIASPDAVVDMFNSLPASVDRTLAYFDGIGHMAWASGGENHDWLKTYITAWMKVYLDGDTSYEQYIDGHQDWFYRFEHYAAGEAGSGDGCE